MSNQQRFLLNNCCFCCTVETGSKIIGYLGAIGAGIYIILGVTSLILLSIAQASGATVVTTTVPGNNNVNGVNGVNNVNVAGDNNASDASIIAAFILTVFIILVYILVLIVNIVLLIGINKQRPNYVKFYLIVSIVSLVLAFILGIISVITTFSAGSIITLIYLLLPLYFLLVVRTAYYNMLETDASKPNIIYAPAPNVAPPPATNDNVA